MKLTKLGLCAVPIALAFTLTGCNYVDAGVDFAKSAVTDDTVGEHMTKGEVVETANGSYTRVKASEDHLNSFATAPEGEREALIGNTDPNGAALDTGRSGLKQAITEYFYSHFIDSSALEGGSKTMKAWTADAIKKGNLTDTKYTKEWLDLPGGYPVLSSERITNTSTLEPFIHDGKPRLKDANIEFGADDKFKWEDTADGIIYGVPTTWSVDYRITDEAVFEMMRVQLKKKSEDEVLAMLKDEAKDGKGENILRITGDSFFDLRGSEDGYQIYVVDHGIKADLPDVVKPEFENTPPSK